jgi:hypothetical protein
MKFDGVWIADERGVTCPVLTGAVRDDEGIVHPVPFLVDTGAELTVLSYDAVSLLEGDSIQASGYALESISGASASLRVATTVWFRNSIGQMIPFRGEFAGCADPLGMNMSLLGRDILREFALIVDRPRTVICLLTGRHTYSIQES